MKKVLSILGLLCIINLTFAQEFINIQQNGHKFKVSATRATTDFDPANIAFWVGEGENSAVVTFQWCNGGDPVGFAYGFKWNGTATIKDMADAIDNADERFTITYASTSTPFINDYSYQDEDYNVYLEEEVWCMYTQNGQYCNGMTDVLQNNAYVEFVEFSNSCELPTTNIIPASNPVSAATDATISEDQITYWIGEGENKVILAVNWCDPEIALAWGVKFSGDNVTVENIMNLIQENDTRFSYTAANGWLDDIKYEDENMTLMKSGMYWMYNVNGVGAMVGFTQQIVENGDLVKFGDESCGTADENWNYSWTTEIQPVSEPANTQEFESPISNEEITYWVGEGENSAIAIFYWCQDITAGLAYGYRWNGTTTIGEMLNAISTADSRFTIDISDMGWINSYSFQDVNYNMHLANEGFLLYSVNGDWDAFLTMNDEIANGDVFQMQEYSDCAMMEHVFPVSDPLAPNTQFDGIVGTENCQAIYFEDEHILGWATGCTIVRGPQDIINNPTVAVTFGSESDALGTSSLSTMECVSLGDGGSATLTFDIPIENGDGYDFAVFENSLNGEFLELAFVEVSSDGENFVRFPATSNTQTATQIANAGTIDAANINNLAGKYVIGWGTPFDLEELAGNENLDINHITHVRIVDVVGTIDPMFATRDRYGRIINDPYPTDFYSSGFDLSGVAVLNGWKPVGIDDYESSKIYAYPNPCADKLYIVSGNEETIELYTISGQLLQTVDNYNAQTSINMANYPAGVYLLKVGNNIQKVLKK